MTAQAQSYDVLTTDAESTIELHPGALYFADFELHMPVQFNLPMEAGQFGDWEADLFKDELKRAVRLKADEENINLEIDLVSLELRESPQPETRFVVQGSMDPASASSDISGYRYLYGYRVYFRVYSTPVHVVIGVLILATLFMGATWAVMYEGAPVLIRLCRAAENVAVTATDAAKAVLKTPQDTIKVLGMYAIPIAILVVSVGWAFVRRK